MRLMGEQFVAGQTIERGAGQRPRPRGARASAIPTTCWARRRSPRRRPSATSPATQQAIHAIGRAAGRPRHLRRPGHLDQAVGAASALQPRPDRARACRALSAPEGAGGAGARARHRAQHRCRGGRSARAVARPAGAAVLRAGAGGLERHRLRGAGLPEARPFVHRLADRPRAAQRPSADGAAGQGRLLGQRDQARAGRRAGRTSRSSRARSTPTSPTSPARASCWRRPTRCSRNSPPTTR